LSEKLAAMESEEAKDFREVCEVFYLDTAAWYEDHINSGELPASVSESTQMLFEHWLETKDKKPVPADKPAVAVTDNVGLIPMHNGKPDITDWMKVECIGEFSWQEEAPYHDEDGDLHDYVATRAVPWDLCKEIYKRMASAALLAAAPFHSQQSSPWLKDNQIAGIINSVRDVALTYAGTQQLRERIAGVLRPVLCGLGDRCPSHEREQQQSPEAKFIQRYCERSGLSVSEVMQTQVCLPCSCSDDGCEGFAMVSNNPLSIKAHNMLYGRRRESEQGEGAQ
jgi:hypothetical protein